MSLIASWPILQIRPYGLLVYEHKEYDTNPRRSEHKKEVNKSLYTGKLTEFSKKRLKRAISLLVASAVEKQAPNFRTGKFYKFKVNFLTFTLPAAQEKITDGDLKTCLDNWIKRAKRKYNLNNYVWRAERQANGNLHFHMVSDTWIHYENIRNDWNSVLKETGLIEKFRLKHGHENPNSTDVHAIQRIRNLTSYFVKYMSKKHKDGEEPIHGKIWDCSERLKTKENCWTHLENYALKVWNALRDDLSLEQLNDPLFSIIFIPLERFAKEITGELNEVWQAYLKRIRDKPPPVTTSSEVCAE